MLGEEMKTLLVTMLMLEGCCSGPVSELFDGAMFIPRELTYGLCDGLSSGDHPEIDQGFNFWNNEIGHLAFTPGGCHTSDIQIHISDSDDGRLGRVRRGTEGTNFFVIELAVDWITAPEAWTRQNVMRHEIGHVIGFGHSPCPTCLMYRETRALRERGLCASEREALTLATDQVQR